MMRVLTCTIAGVLLVCAVTAALMAQEKQGNGKDSPDPDVKQAEENTGLVIEQVCNGFPGSDEKKKKTKQKITIKGNKIYMQNLDGPNLCIVRGDKKVIWEVNTEANEYDARFFDYFDELKTDNEKDRKEYARIINDIPDPKSRLKLAEKRGYIADETGKVSTKPVAKTELTGEEKEVNGYKCYHLKVYEDAKVVLDVWLTKQHKSPDSLMDFYKKLGCFCDEVIAEIQKIRDFPVYLKAHLAFGAMAIPIECEISKIENAKIDDKLFELPKDAKCKREIRTRKDQERKGVRICPVCGKEFDPEKEKPFIFKHKGVDYLLDSDKCRKKLGAGIAKHKGDERKALDEFRKEWKKGK